MSVARIGCVDVEDDDEDVLSVILRSAESTESGAGKIWVLLRTGEHGLDAL